LEPRKKRIKKEIFSRTRGYTFFEHKRHEELLEKFKLEPADKKLRKCINNRMPKNAELWTKWTKMTWKTYKYSDKGKLGLSRPNS
jgi:hypothetical protein